MIIVVGSCPAGVSCATALINRGFEVTMVDPGPSLARGRFSNVWGEVAAPYSSQDLTDWPVSADDLTTHYEAVLEVLEGKT